MINQRNSTQSTIILINQSQINTYFILQNKYFYYKRKMLRNIELRKLPAGTLNVIVDILEINSDWRKVMSIIPKDPNGDHFEPKYNIEHIRLIEQYAKVTNQKCSEILFDEWGTSGRVRPTLSTLKNIVVAAGIYRAADEIAILLEEPLPARPFGGPEQQISTNVTEMLNQSLQQQNISTAQAKDYYNINVYQDQTTEPIQNVYYGVEFLNTEDLPNFTELQPEIGNKPTEQMKSVSDFIKFTTEQHEPYGENSTEIIKESENTKQSIVKDIQKKLISKEITCHLQPEYKDTETILRGSPKPSSNIDLDSVISQDTNLIHFGYNYLERITNFFSENPPTDRYHGSSGKIGSGGFGDVFIGIHPEFGALAIKRANQQQLRYYKPELVSKVFNSEVKYLSKFRHNNIVPILGYSVDGPAPCIVCEYISGGSLLEKISKKVLNEDQRISIMIGAAEGLKYLHTSRQIEFVDSDSQNSANNFMHGDVKSANILLTDNNVPKLCDFGLAKQYEATCEVSFPMGTSAYMSPEGLRGTITQKLDIYSFGIVLLELLTGLPPIVKDRNGEKINIKHYVIENCENNDITQLLDQVAQWTKANNIFKLTQMCLEDDRNKRPTMSVVCDALYDINNTKNL